MKVQNEKNNSKVYRWMEEPVESIWNIWQAISTARSGFKGSGESSRKTLLCQSDSQDIFERECERNINHGISYFTLWTLCITRLCRSQWQLSRIKLLVWSSALTSSTYVSLMHFDCVYVNSLSTIMSQLWHCLSVETKECHKIDKQIWH